MCVKIDRCPACILGHLMAVVQIVANSLKKYRQQINFVTSLKYFTAPYKVFLIQILHNIFFPQFNLSTDLCLIFICQLWIRSISSNTHSQQPMYNNVRIPTISSKNIFKKVSKEHLFSEVFILS